MIKKEVSQELKKEFAQGNLKPSQLKKSKSLDNLTSPAKQPLKKTKSAEELKPINSQIEQLETKISVLELELEVKSRELTELNSLTEENKHLKEQMKMKQKEIESLRKDAESTQAELKTLKTEQSTLLDQNLTLKHQNLKDWFQQYEKTQKVEKELAENIEYASEELVKQDQQISQLQKENMKLKQTNQTLQKDLNLTQRLIELRSEMPYYADDFNHSLTYFKYALYALFTVWFLLILRRNNV